MHQRLELPELGCPRGANKRCVGEMQATDADQPMILISIAMQLEPSLLGFPREGGELDVCGQITPAGVFQQLCDASVAAVSGQGAVLTFRCKILSRRQAI